MLLPDLNVLLYTHRTVSIRTHARRADCLAKLATGPEPFAFSDLVLSDFGRIATNRRVFDPPSTTDEGFRLVAQLVERPTARVVGPSPNHLLVFEMPCPDAGATGKLVADAQHAAVALGHGCTMVSTDSELDRFPGRRWQHP